MMDVLPLLVAAALIVLGLGGAVTLVILMSAAKGAGDELGRAALSQWAPAICRLIAKLAISTILIRTEPAARRRLLAELCRLIDAEFERRTSASERVAAIFVVLGQLATVARSAARMRAAELDLASTKPIRDTLGGMTLRNGIMHGSAPTVAHFKRLLYELEHRRFTGRLRLEFRGHKAVRAYLDNDDLGYFPIDADLLDYILRDSGGLSF